MASNLYQQLNGQTQTVNNVNLKDLMAFSKSLGGKNPQSIVQNMLQTGMMSKEDFDAYGKEANRILGR